MTLRLLPGNPDPARFACPWCGATFATRWAKPRRTREEAQADPPSLEAHWWANPECSANRAVNNPTQTKYDVVADPGLRLPDREDRDA